MDCLVGRVTKYNEKMTQKRPKFSAGASNLGGIQTSLRDFAEKPLVTQKKVEELKLNEIRKNI